MNTDAGIAGGIIGDTLACIAGGAAAAAFGVPDEIREQALDYLDAPLRELVSRFEARWPAVSR